MDFVSVGWLDIASVLAHHPRMSSRDLFRPQYTQAVRKSVCIRLTTLVVGCSLVVTPSETLAASTREGPDAVLTNSSVTNSSVTKQWTYNSGLYSRYAARMKYSSNRRTNRANKAARLGIGLMGAGGGVVVAGGLLALGFGLRAARMQQAVESLNPSDPNSLDMVQEFDRKGAAANSGFIGALVVGSLVGAALLITGGVIFARSRRHRPYGYGAPFILRF